MALGLTINKTKLQVKNIQEALDQQGRAAITAFNNFTEQARGNKRQLDKIVDAQQKAQRELELRAQLEQKRQLVQGSAAAFSLLAKLAFSKDPVAVARIDTGVSSIARITDSVLQLSSGLNPTTGAKLLLSTNIAGGALALISMFGPQNSETDIMKQQLSAIRQDISALRQDMDERFDRLENMLVEAMNYIGQRLSNIDTRLQNIEENLRKMGKTMDVLYHVSRDTFNFLIAHEFEESARQCAREVLRAEMSSDKAFDCIEKSSNYARKGANKYAVSSGSLYDVNVDVDVGAVIGASLPAIEQVGYLDAVLRQASQSQMLKRDYAVSAEDLISPPDWATAVDGFSSIIANPSQFKAFKVEGVRSDRLVRNYSNDIADIIKIGERAKGGIATMRKDGVQFALDRMADKVGKLADLATNMVVENLSKKDLSILSVGDLEFDAEIRSTHNTDFKPEVEGWAYGVRFSATKYFFVTEGKQKGRQWEGQWRVSRFDDVQRTYDSRVPRDAYVRDWKDFFRSRYATLLSGGALTLEYNRTILDLQDRLSEVNGPYLENGQVGDLTASAKTDLYAAYSHIESLAPHEPQEAHAPTKRADALQDAILIISPDDDKKQQLQAVCDEIAKSRQVVSAYAGLIRTSFTQQDEGWRVALSELPETSADLCGALLKVPNQSDATNQKLPVKEFMAVTIKDRLIPKIERFRTLFDRADQSGGMDMIDARLRGLRTFIHAPAPN